MVLIVGCGGGDDEPIADFDTLSSCLQGDGAAVASVEVGSDVADLIANGAGEGAIQVDWNDDQNFVNIAVERSADDAADTADQYGDGFGDLSHIERTGNVVTAYANEPDDDELALIDGCLGEAASANSG